MYISSLIVHFSHYALSIIIINGQALFQSLNTETNLDPPLGLLPGLISKLRSMYLRARLNCPERLRVYSAIQIYISSFLYV